MPTKKETERLSAEEKEALIAERPAAEMPAENDVEGQPPAQSAVKMVWVDYAVAQGMEQAEAEDMTKDALIDRFGG